MRRTFITILLISTAAALASCKKTSDTKQSVPITGGGTSQDVGIGDESVGGIPVKKLLGDFSHMDIGRSFNLTLSSDRTYRLEQVLGCGGDDEHLKRTKTSGTWSIEKSLIMLTPVSTDADGVFGDFIILAPEISRDGHTGFSARLKDDAVWDHFDFYRPEDLSVPDEKVPNKALVPTIMSVTPAADAPVAPATTAAHL